jgi:hypothetical protein
VNRDVAADLTQVPKCHHDRSDIEGAEPPTSQWLWRHILPPSALNVPSPRVSVSSESYPFGEDPVVTPRCQTGGPIL